MRHCFEELPGDLVYWKEIEAMGIQLHQARVLYDEHFLSWMPKYPMRVNPLQLAELKFLYGIRFKTGIGVEMIETAPLTILANSSIYENTIKNYLDFDFVDEFVRNAESTDYNDLDYF